MADVKRAQAILGGLVAMMLVLSAVTAVAAPMDQYKYDDSADTTMPESVVSGDVTKDVHDMEWSSPLLYESDAGDLESLPGAMVNKTDDKGDAHNNPFSFNATEINVSEYGEFPRKSEETGDNEASALDASEWWINSTSSPSGSTSDVTTAPNVDGVELSASSVGSSDAVYFEYSNFSVTSDADKRFVQVALDVTSTGSSSAEVRMTINDSDGDYVDVYLLNQSNDNDDFDTAANLSTEGHVLQEQIGNLTVHGSGDGSMGEIQHINISVTGDDATVQIAALNVEKMSEWTYGEKKMDSDDDDALETSTITEPHGSMDVHSLDTVGSTFDNARIRDLTFPFKQRARALADEDTKIEFNATNKYPGFDFVGHVQYVHHLPDAYDLSYANLELRITSESPESRYQTTAYEGAVGANADWSDISYPSSFTINNEDERVTIDGTLSPGDHDAVQIKWTVTADEKQELAAPSTGGSAPVNGGDSGGFSFLDLLTSPITWLMGVASAAFARARGAI